MDLTPTAGDRVELVATSDPFTSLRPGDRGTVLDVDVDEPPIAPRRQVKFWIEWDSGSTLAMLQGEDQLRVVEDADAESAQGGR